MSTPHLTHKQRSILSNKKQQNFLPDSFSSTNKQNVNRDSLFRGSSSVGTSRDNSSLYSIYRNPQDTSNELLTSSLSTNKVIIDSEIPPTESILDDGLPIKLKPNDTKLSTTTFIPTATTIDKNLSTFSTPMRSTNVVGGNKFFSNNKKVFTPRSEFLPSGSTTKPRNTLLASTHRSPSQTDPFYEIQDKTLANIINEKVKESTWVTVFGFPPTKSSIILKLFSTYGTIINHKLTNGNYMHIQFKSRFQADKALSKNGKVIDGNLMIGVVECLDSTILLEQQKERENFENYAKRRRNYDEEEISNIEASGTNRFRSLDEEDDYMTGTYASGPSYNNTTAYGENIDYYEPVIKRKKPEASQSIWNKFVDYVFKF
ncbi:hypothetical protein ABK040_007979 [Willaertia magna]